MDRGISTSVFELFKIGPGPSSSHTIGPMRAAADFRSRLLTLAPEALARGTRIELAFFGSLADTGRGHGSDRAAAAGLMGDTPDRCDTGRLAGLLAEGSSCDVELNGRVIAFSAADILWNRGEHEYPFQNTMRLRLFDAAGSVLLEEVYYSVGGGFIQRAGTAAEDPPIVPYRYRNMDGFKLLVLKYGQLPVRLLMANEIAAGGHASEAEVNVRLDRIIDTMLAAVDRGLRTEGLLPGPIGLARRAGQVYARAQAGCHGHDRFLMELNAFALAVAEENAAGNLVVTAPTSGSAGLIPGVLYHLERRRRMSRALLREGLLMAALIGFIARHNASISGAEVGCQGEIGVASAMAAALLAHVHGCSLPLIESAAEIALEHHLGMTCDPIEGYVQIPCIERNAVGAVTAYNAYLLASVSDPDKRKVSFDEVVAAMLLTGREMSATLKETSRGGLALCSLCS